jgi:hypothetical protein
MITGETEHASSEVTLLERQARVAKGHLLQTVDALMNRRIQLVGSVRRIKSALHLLPAAMASVGALLALGVGVSGLHDRTRRTNQGRPPTAKTLALLGAALFVGILTGLGAARRLEPTRRVAG